MIPGPAYLPIFLIVVTIISLYVIQKYRVCQNSLLIDNRGFALFLAIAFSLFIGLRPVDPVFADTVGYASYFNNLAYCDFQFSKDTENLLFDNILRYLAASGFSCNTFFTFIAAIYFIGTFIACRWFFPKNTLAAYLVFLIAFSTFSYSVNGIKAGSAAAIFLCGIAYQKDKPFLSTLLILLSWTFHHSMFVCIAAFFVVQFNNNPKWYFSFWIICLVLSLAHVSYFQNLFMNMSDDKGATYLDVNNMAGWEGRTGFRYDFVMYSFMPILVGWISIYKKKIKSKRYNILLCTYLLTNGIWLLCMYAGFTNRIAYLSWLMYPFVLIYPFLNEECDWGYDKYSIFAVVMFLHMMFTILTFFTGQYH